MKTKHILTAIIAATILIGCGQEHKAKSLVTSFLDNNLKDNSYSIEDYSKLDSTFYVTDSMINVMRGNVGNIGTFKQIKYSDKGNTNKLLFIHVKYKHKGKSWKQTFYMDDNLNQIISLKND